MVDIVLIHPPVALPSEPPVGIAWLAAGLRARGVSVRCIDANAESLDVLLHAARQEQAGTIAERRAIRQLDDSLAALRQPASYGYPANRYRQAVADLGKILDGTAGRHAPGLRLGLAAYADPHRSPLSSNDLRAQAADHTATPHAAYFAALAERVAALRPRLVGLSVNYLHQGLPAMALAGWLRRALPPGTPLLMGGGLVRCWTGRLSAEALQPTVDRLSFGEGLPALLAALEGRPWTEEDERAAAGSGPCPAEEPAVLPDYTDLPWDSYLAPQRVFPLVTSRGCVWGRCRYCPDALVEQQHRPAPAAEIPGLLVRAAAEQGAGLVHLGDSAVPAPVLSALAHSELQLPDWYGFARFEPELAEPGFAAGLRRSGCRMLQLGLESGSPAVLRRLRKGIRLEQASAALRALHDAGIAVYLYVMFGIPGETREDAEQTLRFVADHAEGLCGINTSLLNLPVASPAEEDLELEALPGEGCDLTLYNSFRSASGWERREARHFVERVFSREPRIVPVLHRTPPVFGPNHSPFFSPAGSR